jgi:hypothetical protein
MPKKKKSKEVVYCWHCGRKRKDIRKDKIPCDMRGGH